MQFCECPQCGREFEAVVESGGVIHCPHCAGQLVLSSDDEALMMVGQTIGGYELVEYIGSGGMGHVYRATQLSLNRDVAVKILHGELTRDKDAVDQFIRELRNTGKLQHPNIVVAIEAGESDGKYFFAMTYVEGETLEEAIDRDGALDERAALRYIIQIAEALRYVWGQHDMLHKDIKPGNIMVDDSEKAYLLDMGIAQKLGDNPLNPDGTIMGSPYYMSPEQSRGEELFWESDLYSLGASLYNLVVGEPPFDADDVIEIITMHSRSPFPEPSERSPKAEVSPELVALIKRMMAKKPDDRFESWGEFINEARKTIKSLVAEKTQSIKRKKDARQKGKGRKRSALASAGAGAGKKLAIRQPATARGVRRRSSGKSGMLGLSAAVIVLGIVSFIVYRWYEGVRLERAATAYFAAENAYKDNPEDLERVRHLFRLAAPLVEGTRYQDATEQYIQMVSRRLKEREDRTSRFRDGLFEAERLAKEGDFATAAKILNEIGEFDVPEWRSRFDALTQAVEKGARRKRP